MAETKKQEISEQELTLEENFQKLEEITRQLEDEEISLEQAFGFYSQGMQLIQTCNQQIDRVEKQVLKLSEEAGLEPME